jgi:ERCC4-related helicase
MGGSFLILSLFHTSAHLIAMLIILGTGHDVVFIEHPLINKDAIEQREFQVSIAEECAAEPTLVVLPTGLGKTIVALLVIAKVLGKRDGKILFMAPTKPLVDQHAESLRKNLLVESISSFTGEVPPEKREELWNSSKIIVSTPQVVENDMDSGRCKLSEFSLVIFDEAHRAVGDYAYVRIGERCSAEEKGLVLGMTASPGYDLDKIAEVCRNLGMTNIAVRSEIDEDVAPYVFGIKVEWARVDVPEGVDEITDLLQKILDERIEALKKYHVIDEKRRPGVRDLLTARDILLAKIRGNPRNLHLFRALTIQAGAMKLNHAIDLARTQGRESLKNYFQKVVNEAATKGGSRASKELVKDPRFEMVRRLLDKAGEDHPKLDKLKEIVGEQLRNNPKSRIIVFTHYRDTCDNATGVLSEVSEAKPVRFVGQATKGADTGMKQKEQKEIIDKFKAGEYNILVATSVAEEGLDIPSTDLVVFYEPIPSEIRTIQRRGRTGRHSPGRVVVLLARSTKDEAYLYSSRRKEAKMRMELDGLRRRLKGGKAGSKGNFEKALQGASEEAASAERAKSVPKAQTLISDFGADKISEHQKRMIQGLPNVTSVLAERLLERFGSVQNVLSASTEELMKVEGVGRVIAEGIRKIASDKYG